MPAKKSTPKNTPFVPVNSFEAELDLAIHTLHKDAPEFANALEPELTNLKAKIIEAHEAYSAKELAEKEEHLKKAEEVIALMEQDMNALKTTILRMAVTQYS